MNMLSLDALGATQDGEQLDIMQCLADRSGPDVLERLNLKETAAALERLSSPARKRAAGANPVLL